MAFSAFNDFCAAKGITAEVVPEAQNGDYESGIAAIGGESWHIRTARNTPTKPGGFTAFWARSSSGSTEPFDESNVLDGLVVFIKDAERRGAFRFTPTLLIQLGVVRSASSQAPGKRGFRVYPGWCTDLSPQARATQQAQAAAFMEY